MEKYAAFQIFMQFNGFIVWLSAKYDSRFSSLGCKIEGRKAQLKSIIQAIHNLKMHRETYWLLNIYSQNFAICTWKQDFQAVQEQNCFLLQYKEKNL